MSVKRSDAGHVADLRRRANPRNEHPDRLAFRGGFTSQAPEGRLLPLPCHRLLGRCLEASSCLISGSNRGVVLGRAIVTGAGAETSISYPIKCKSGHRRPSNRSERSTPAPLSAPRPFLPRPASEGLGGALPLPWALRGHSRLWHGPKKSDPPRGRDATGQGRPSARARPRPRS